MSTQLADLFYGIRAEGLDKLGNQLNALGDTIGNIGEAMVDNISKPIMDFFMKGIDIASDVSESMNVVNVTFKKGSQDVKDWSTTLLDSFGLTEKEALQYAGSMGAMLKSSGFTEDAARIVSKSLVELTGDMSSFYNLDHDETWEKIRAGIAGETEPLKALGINMSVANLEAYALSEGIKKSWKEMDQGEQVSLRYGYLMKVTADAQGDFNRTQDGFANKLRTVKGRIDDFAKSLGEILLPFVEKAINIFDDLFIYITTSIPGIDKMAVIFGLLAAAVGPVLIAVGGLIVGLGGIVGAITAVVAVISTVGMPIFVGIAGAVMILSGWFVALGTAIGTTLITIGTIILKTGLLQQAFDTLKNTFSLVKAVLDNDIGESLRILVQNFGMSEEEAVKFYIKMRDVRDMLSNVWEMIKNVGSYLNSIFSDNAKEQIDILVNKFGMTKDEAKKVTDNIQNLKTKLIELGQKLKEVAGDALSKFLLLLKDVLKWIYDNRDGIIKFINILVNLGSTAITIGGYVVKAFQLMYTVAKTTIDLTKTLISGLFNKWTQFYTFVGNTTVFKTFKSIAVSALEKAVDLGGDLIDLWVRMESAVWKVVKAISKIVIPGGLSNLLPGHADGIKNASYGHFAMVGEKGPELMYVPKNSSIYTAPETKRMLNSAGNNINTNTTQEIFNFNGTIQIDPTTIKDVESIIDIFKGLKYEMNMR